MPCAAYPGLHQDGQGLETVIQLTVCAQEAGVVQRPVVVEADIHFHAQPRVNALYDLGKRRWIMDWAAL